MATTLDRFVDRKPGWDTPVMIESHQNGVRTKAMNPNTPVTYEEIVEDAIRCWDAGASAILLCTEDQTGLEHVAYLHKDANVQVAVVDTGIDLFAVDLDEKGHILGREYGWNYKRVAGQVDFCQRNDIAMIWGVYEPGHLRLARHYVDRGMHTNGSMWDFYLVGKYGLTSSKPIGTCGMEPTLESLYYYLDMIEHAKHKLPWCISIWGEGSLDTRPIIKRAIELGGHIKTGLELFFDPDRNPTNLDLLQEAGWLRTPIRGRRHRWSGRR
jgi:uncharacterized protein (DUF849 family)